MTIAELPQFKTTGEVSSADLIPVLDVSETNQYLKTKNLRLDLLVQVIAVLGSFFNKVDFPANSAAPGQVGQYAVNGDEFAIYVQGAGWRFVTLYAK